jgi:hypothetical protein
MRTPEFTRRRMVAVVLATAILTILATRRLVGQLAARGRIPPADTARIEPGPVEVRPRVPRRDGRPFVPPPGLMAAATFPTFDVQVDGRRVSVMGEVHVDCAEPGHAYIWLLRAHAVGDDPKQLKVHKEHHYLENAISLAEGESRMKPAFADTIELAPGRYKIELILYAVPPGFNFEGLKFGEDMGPKAIIDVSRSRRITISE